MGFETKVDSLFNRTNREVGIQAPSMFADNAMHARQLVASMPTNRELINKIQKFGLQKI